MRELLSASRTIVYPYFYRSDIDDMLHAGLDLAFDCGHMSDCYRLRLTSEEVLTLYGGE